MKVIASQVKLSIVLEAAEMFTTAGALVKSERREVPCDLVGHLPQNSFTWSLDIANCPQPSDGITYQILLFFF